MTNKAPSPKFVWPLKAPSPLSLCGLVGLILGAITLECAFSDVTLVFGEDKWNTRRQGKVRREILSVEPGFVVWLVRGGGRKCARAGKPHGGGAAAFVVVNCI